MLHVHDLVDYVSQEAAAAGKNATRYLMESTAKTGPSVELYAEGGVRYTVPSRLRPERMDDTITVRFRVDNIYRDHAIAVYLDDTLLQKKKRPVMAPGEMEQIVLDKKKLTAHPSLQRITVRIEEA